MGADALYASFKSAPDGLQHHRRRHAEADLPVHEAAALDCAGRRRGPGIRHRVVEFLDAIHGRHVRVSRGDGCGQGDADRAGLQRGPRPHPHDARRERGPAGQGEHLRRVDGAAVLPDGHRRHADARAAEGGCERGVLDGGHRSEPGVRPRPDQPRAVDVQPGAAQDERRHGAAAGHRAERHLRRVRRCRSAAGRSRSCSTASRAIARRRSRWRTRSPTSASSSCPWICRCTALPRRPLRIR